MTPDLLLSADEIRREQTEYWCLAELHLLSEANGAILPIYSVDGRSWLLSVQFSVGMAGSALALGANPGWSRFLGVGPDSAA